MRVEKLLVKVIPGKRKIYRYFGWRRHAIDQYRCTLGEQIDGAAHFKRDIR